MAKFDLRLRARKLRKSGKSIRAIADTLGVSRASASIWCRDVQLSQRQHDLLVRAQIKAGHRGRMLGAEMNRQKKRDNIIEQERIAREMIGVLSERDKLMLGIALYWGEGVKASQSQAAIVNSDPATILFARDWFIAMGIARNRLQPAIYLPETHRSREKQVVLFWSQLLHVPASQFANVTYIKHKQKKIYENHNSYYGVLALRIRQGTTFKYRIKSMIQICKEQAGIAQSVRASVS